MRKSPLATPDAKLLKGKRENISLEQLSLLKYLSHTLLHIYRVSVLGHTAKPSSPSFPRLGRFILPSVRKAHSKGFAMCPTKYTRKRALCRKNRCCVPYAKCNTWHTPKLNFVSLFIQTGTHLWLLWVHSELFVGPISMSHVGPVTPTCETHVGGSHLWSRIAPNQKKTNIDRQCGRSDGQDLGVTWHDRENNTSGSSFFRD